MPNPHPVSWVILAGGQATRMGGEDKGLIELAGIPLIHHVFNRLSAQTDSISINANRNLDEYRQLAPVFKDELTGYPGPLGGIHAGLTHSSTHWVGFVPCDSPYLADDYVKRFMHEISDDIDILVAHDGEHQQPVFCMYHQNALPKLNQFLERGERKVRLLYRECKVGYVDFSDATHCFINLNTPQQLSEYGQKNDNQ
ncbi:molybdenum cofactor guanylyltransferase MobA [Vibrio ulleungensis]|uniref:Molybdenum cofactor guanylyltransferase n=1 Tax=Vibrio ulleungensis TaxID=2807619 RepID=A0ABS2HGB3_9VIBR|nr:molybdenum cofactor guanylyltransferase MobA [Vibrio ulleungensis]MBM7035099.1 molybdenum cofactor guanylyltransferase MobA [Vibrio ulleungensis]